LSRRIAAAAIGLTALILQGCGAPPETLPEPLVCPTPTPGPTVTAGGQVFGGRYINNTNTQLNRLEAIGAGFIDRWPNKRFSRTAEFREDLARTSDQAACLATQIQAIPSPGTRYDEYDRALDAVLAQFAIDVSTGREAARQRNTSTFRDWLAFVEGLPMLLDAVQSTAPPRQ